MPVPFEALLPYGVMAIMFGVTGFGVSALRTANNGGKRQRYALGHWDRQMMERDRRLTGYLRGQTDQVDAPAGFEVSNPWKVEFLHR